MNEKRCIAKCGVQFVYAKGLQFSAIASQRIRNRDSKGCHSAHAWRSRSWFITRWALKAYGRPDIGDLVLGKGLPFLDSDIVTVPVAASPLSF
ncbi:hypothetical protein CDAR_493821 [Caerostris darwini]|uniref:Uncharacterized protein n=1 Tax=Caerostris darwini TaxID=1538125 RepID=A0AAV4VTH7_9ARAC|nr:hypothetical protein CDAR_493821 [Caerostris darwini]